MNTTFTAPCGTDLSAARMRATSMMTATPHLSSAPSSVVPSVVAIVLPINFVSSGFSLTLMTRERSFGSTRSPPG